MCVMLQTYSMKDVDFMLKTKDGDSNLFSIPTMFWYNDL